MGNLLPITYYLATFASHLPDVLMATTTVLSQYQNSDVQTIVQSSLEHGVLRST